MAIKTAAEYQKLAGGDMAKALSLMAADMSAIDEARQAAEVKASGIAVKLTLKVSPKGAVSVYGLGRWPVTLYREQFARLLNEKAAIERFIVANNAALKSKGDTADDEPAEKVG
jgi:hypothetical protein